MGKIYWILISCFILVGNIYGQPLVCERDVTTKRCIDTCELRVHYTYRYSPDTLNKQGVFDRMVLDVGRRCAHYYSSNADRRDSMAFRARRAGQQEMDTKQMLASNEKISYGDVYSDFPYAGQRLISNRIWEADYEYEEPMRDMAWNIRHIAQDSIVGYACQRAICTWRGRTYEVWYTLDIPVKYGPWKFYGLPGLILSAKDIEGFFSWEATTIEMPNKKAIWVYDSSLAGDFGHRNINITRSQWLRLERMIWEDQALLMQTLNIKALIKKNGRYVSPRPGDLTTPYIPPLELE